MTHAWRWQGKIQAIFWRAALDARSHELMLR
jgi:hypothetical protein